MQKPPPGGKPPPPNDKKRGSLNGKEKKIVRQRNGLVAVYTTLGPHPQVVICPYCRNCIQTEIEVRPNVKTHLTAAVLLLAAGYYCGCFLPYLMDSCLSKCHFCPICDQFLGKCED